MESRETVLTQLFGMGWPAPHRVIWNEAAERWLDRDGREPALAAARPARIAARSSRGCRSARQARMAALADARRGRFFGPFAPTADGPSQPARRGRALRRRVGRADPRHPARRRARAGPGRARREAPAWSPAPPRRSCWSRSRSRSRCCATTRRRRRPSRRPRAAEAGRAAVRRRRVPAVRLRGPADDGTSSTVAAAGWRTSSTRSARAASSASVARTTRWRRAVERAGPGRGCDADDLEAMLFLESAGRPTVMADGTPNSATGLMQIIPVDRRRRCSGCAWTWRAASRSTARCRARSGSAVLSRKAKKRRAARRRVRALLRERKVVDERFDPREGARRARFATCRVAQRRFGRRDLAIASYHMGIGNLRTRDRHLRLAAPARAHARGRTVAATACRGRSSTTTRRPTRNPRTWDLLTELGDDSRHYLFKVLASREILRLARDGPGRARAPDRAPDGEGERRGGAAAGVALPALRGRRGPPPRLQARASSCRCRTTRCGWRYRAGRRMGSLARRLDAAADPLPRAAARGARHACSTSRRSTAGSPARRQAAAGDEHRARPPLPGAARRDEHPGDARVLAPHDRLRDRHREAARGGAAALPARAPPGAQRDRVGRGAGRVPPDGRPRGERASCRSTRRWSRTAARCAGAAQAA